MKWYHLFFMCNFLLNPYALVFGMEEEPKNTDLQRNNIIKILEQKDPNKVLLRPDKLGFYTPELFMKNLVLEKDKLEKILKNYCDHTERIFINATKPKIREKSSEFMDDSEKANEQEKTPPDPQKVLEFLRAHYKDTKEEEKKPQYEEFKHLKDTLLLVGGCYSIDTGVDLSNPAIDPTQNPMAVSVVTIQLIKKIVKQELEKLKKKR